MDRVAGAVSDGKAVDWMKEKTKRPEHLRDLEQLSVVDRIRKVHESCTLAAGPSEDDVETKLVPKLAATPPPGEPPIFQWGSLQVLEKIDVGGGGEVFRAFDPSLRSEVALKLLRQDYADSDHLARRFLDEARRLARVRHPNVLTVYGADRHDGRIGMWTELVRGRSLERYVAEHGRLSACEATVIGLELCRALAAVHAAGLIHRDVKTTNVMRADGGRIVLMDFGSVAELPEGGLAAWAAGVEGTPISMPPEQLRGKIAGPATDIYGLGVLLYRLVTRRYPVEASSLEELDAKHRRGDQTPLRDRRADLPLEFVQVVETALQSDPSKRYQSAGEMEQALAATFGALAKQERLRRKHQGILVAAGIAAAVVVGVLGGTMLGSRRGDDAARAPLASVAVLPAKPAPLRAEVTLVRRVGDVEETLQPGARVSPGDELGMFLRGSDSLYLYVFNADATGKVFGLFPIPDLEPANPLRGLERHRLPGSLRNQIVYWNVTSPGERERIIAIGLRARDAGLDSVIARFPRARPGHPIEFGTVDPVLLENMRGMGVGAAVPPPKGEPDRRLDAAIEGIRARGEASGDAWVWTIELENPAARR